MFWLRLVNALNVFRVILVFGFSLVVGWIICIGVWFVVFDEDIIGCKVKSCLFKEMVWGCCWFDMVIENVCVELDVDKDEGFGNMWIRCFFLKVCGVEIFCIELLDFIIVLVLLIGNRIELGGGVERSGKGFWLVVCMIIICWFIVWLGIFVFIIVG